MKDPSGSLIRTDMANSLGIVAWNHGAVLRSSPRVSISTLEGPEEEFVEADAELRPES